MKYRAIGTVVVVLVVFLILSASPAWADSLTAITSATGLGSYAASNLADLGPAGADPSSPDFIASGSSIGVSGIPGLKLTFANGTGLGFTPGFQRWDEVDPSGLPPVLANFSLGTPLLYNNNNQLNSFVDFGLVTIAMSSPQRGIGFQIATASFGGFAAELCAYNSSNQLLQPCSDFTGLTSTDVPDGSAPFVGLFDNTGANIDHITVGTVLDVPVSFDGPNDFSFSSPLITTPEPGTLLSLAAGLVGLLAFGFRKKSFRLAN